MKKMIITADDYGMCSIVDQAIDDCIAAGLVTTTNVIVNMETRQAASRLRAKFPNLSIGMHWNITAGKPISKPDDICTLVNPATGNFYNVREFFQRCKNKQVDRSHIERELRAQYDIFRDLCGTADYWNTHQNSALNFNTFGIFNNTALKLNITKTRSFRRTYLKERKLNSKISAHLTEFAKKVVFDVWFGWLVPCSGTKLPDGRVIYFDDYQKSESLENICENIVWGSKNIIEMVVHPAISPHHPQFGTLTDVRVKEWKMFTSDKTLQHLESNGVKLVNFDAIL